MKTLDVRIANHPIMPLILERWSTRAFDPSAEVSYEQLAILFEAARWAPSAFNQQPWHFIFSLRDGRGWEGIRDLLIPFNRSWASSASALICVCSEIDAPGKQPGERFPSYSHSFDSGAAWALLALQAQRLGLNTHAMSGFDIDRAGAILRLPANLKPEAIIALGRAVDPCNLPEELRKREVPSNRKPIEDFVYEANFEQPVIF